MADPTVPATLAKATPRATPRATLLTGIRFGRLVVGDRDPDWPPGQAVWICRCDCGNTISVRAGNLRDRNTMSCGCLNREVRASVTHGHAKRGQSSPEYHAWRNAVDRTTNAKVRNYADYGGRGITMCAEWLHDFPRFLADVGPRPSSLHSLDRYPDNDGPYAPGNVRWAVRREQNENRRNNRFIRVGDVVLTRSAWARRVGIHAETIRYRMACGQSPEMALGLSGATEAANG